MIFTWSHHFTAVNIFSKQWTRIIDQSAVDLGGCHIWVHCKVWINKLVIHAWHACTAIIINVSYSVRINACAEKVETRILPSNIWLSTLPSVIPRHIWISRDSLFSYLSCTTCSKHWWINPMIDTLKVLVTTIDAQWEGMGNVGLARHEPALLPPMPDHKGFKYSN